MYRALRVTEDEVREVVRVGSPVGVTMFPQWVHPFYLLAGIPMEMEALKADRWGVLPGAVACRLSDLSRHYPTMPGPGRYSSWAAVAAVCVNGILRQPSGLVYVAGVVVDVIADGLYPHSGPHSPAVPGGRNLRDAVEAWLATNLSPEDAITEATVPDLWPVDPELLPPLPFSPDSRRVREEEGDAA